MYTIKYRPNKLEDFIGNKQLVQPFIQWLLEWDASNKKTKCALFSGVNGVGKSLLIELLLRRHDYNIIELACDDDRDKNYINEFIKPLLKTKRNINGQDNALVVSDIDSNSGDYGFIASLVDCIKDTCIPIICICDDRYSQNIKPILNYCVDFKLTKPSYDDVYRLIYKVVTTEGIRISKQSIDKLYEQSNGDIRIILNTLQLGTQSKAMLNKGKDIQNLSIFDTAGQLFSQENSIEDKQRYYWMEPDIHTLMVQENYITNTLNTNDSVKRMENLAYSADSLSDGDILDAVFDFELSPYVALNTIKATSKCSKKGFGSIKFPQFLGKTATINKNKREKVGSDEFKLLGKNTNVSKAKSQPKVKAELKAKKETKSKK